MNEPQAEPRELTLHELNMQQRAMEKDRRAIRAATGEAAAEAVKALFLGKTEGRKRAQKPLRG